ncbi:hypothetical protein [Streptomyces sp. NPDC051776]|uniref:hypothetical protein n=1 Tax=Streptomyces sp. NPDC051776 TaxID=3155414 RepID=UPI003415183B
MICGGFDECTEEIFPLLATVARAGYCSIALDGSGQGGALEESGLTMTADWELRWTDTQSFPHPSTTTCERCPL